MAGDSAARPFAVGRGGVTIRGEAAGEGPQIVLCHGLTATRRSVVHGSRRLERGGHTVIAYDARGHGESDPAAAGGYGYPELVGDLSAVVDEQAGEGPIVLAGHSMGAHTAVAFALRHPDRVAGLVAIGPTYLGTQAPVAADSEEGGAGLAAESLRYWDGLADALERDGIDGFVAYIGRAQEVAPAWRDSVLRFTRERMERHRHLDAIVRALREVPRSRPFGGLDELEALTVPTLVVASHDAADPGHPHAVATEYARRIPSARLISEAAGQSPLAWQGGRLSREIETFCRELQ
ncbi:MAG TPA: alpha/beta fold hydrolase [Solirubrobacterales bacterium]|nr:alpha/beta fold hydrolase [Solirubrobacterales bacterium]